MSNNIKYQTLLSILDKISREAPSEFTSYHPTEGDTESINKARSKAFIHLYLKVKCNMSSFRDRHNHTTDKDGDGGIDAYYFDNEKKCLFLVQSKFRINDENFKLKSISADDIIKMEITKILKGTEIEKYNSKIKELHNKWKQISDHANWVYKVIFLGNLTKYS